MKKHIFLSSLILIFAIELAVLIAFVIQDTGNLQDAVAINEVVQSVQMDWDMIKHHTNQTDLDYVVLDAYGAVLFKTKDGLSESINAAINHQDTILDIKTTIDTDDGINADSNMDTTIETTTNTSGQTNTAVDTTTETNGETNTAVETTSDTAGEVNIAVETGSAAGKIIIYNHSAQILQSQKQTAVLIFSAAIFIQCCICICYSIYLNHTIIKPFYKLKNFAQRVAGGNLDIPLTMDRQNLFGSFTESFDLMRTELKKARIAEAEANASKKELVAKLSHDIKTPIASIKAASELGTALTDNEKLKDNYMQIIRKADQINTLITNLFTATLEELKQLSVIPADMESKELKTLLENSDYLHLATIPDIPVCLLYVDKLRLQQVFDNIFANSYKYANTNIDLTIRRNNTQLMVTIEDYGGGVSRSELPFLKEKFKRGSHTDDIEGAGLGLYISDYFMKEMRGVLTLQNGCHGLLVTVSIPLSGTI